MGTVFEASKVPLHKWMLANHLMNALIEDGFDLAYMDRFRDGTMLEHAFDVMYEHYFDRPRPLVPITLSRYLPNQATPARCYALGQSLRRAIERCRHRLVDSNIPTNFHSSTDGILRRKRSVLSSIVPTIMVVELP